MLLYSVIFLIWTVFFVVAFASVIKILHVLIQPGQLFGFWQEKLRQWDIQGTAWGNLKFKVLGGCPICFAHLLSLVFFVVFASFMHGVLDLWVPGWGNFLIDIIANVVFFFCFVHLTTLAGLLFITKLFK